VEIRTFNALQCVRISWNWWKMMRRRLWTLPGRRSNYGNSWNSWNSFINDLDRVCDEFNALVLAIYIFMRRILVLRLRLQFVNRSMCFCLSIRMIYRWSAKAPYPLLPSNFVTRPSGRLISTHPTRPVGSSTMKGRNWILESANCSQWCSDFVGI